MDKTKIAIVGLGYVGLPLGLQFVRSGVEVIGLDVDEIKVDSLNQGRSYIKHISATDIQSATEGGRFIASTDFSKISEVEAILICVPTPLDQHREPDISYVIKSGEAIAPHLSVSSGDKPKLVVLESTTYPGTTDTELREVLETGSGLKAGKDFHLAYSPEREDPGRTDHSVKSIPKVMGGYTSGCLDRCKDLYLKALDQVHAVQSCRIAEATKLTENIFRSVNIALVNELKVVFHKMDIDVWDVINAAATKPFGYMPFYPGPGLGGHCIPIDPFYLTWKAREYEQHTRFIELAGEINTAMPDYVIARVADALNDDVKSIKGSRILLLGLAYKPNVDDDRESPSYRLIEKLEHKGAKVDYNDPHVPEIRPSREYSQYAGRKSQDISENYDLILLATHHNEYKVYDFSNYNIPVVDTRNCISNKPTKYYQA
ncbi:nucleotide sugar dehydrogenase [bacterium]|nr:nucleotide sugar dehydrogenase [bacterium]